MTAVTHLPLATVAAAEFRKRQKRAREIVGNRGMSPASANRHLAPWLAIACRCGADLPELAELLADRRIDVGLALASEEEKPLREAEARWLAADDICPRSQWVPVLAAARDAAFASYLADEQNAALVSAAAALQRIALHLAWDPNGCHVPPFKFPETAKAAA
jgi:hypothetical protein